MSNHNLPPLKQQLANTSSHQLKQGLKLISQSLKSTLQWTTQFTKIQNKHHEELKIIQKQLQNSLKKNNKLTQKIKKGLDKFTQKICRLCLQEKPSQNFFLMCSCSHSFCYSCLNTYAISKIQDMERVPCPHPGCYSEMKLSSQIYKYLPQKIKLKYLQFQLKNKEKKVDIKNRCLRCLQTQHQGQCKVICNTQSIQSAFDYRKCRKCFTQVTMTEGKRKITCLKCKHKYCYLCGQDWPLKGEHSCSQILKRKQMQKYVKDQSCCNLDCCQTYDGCCVCCQCCQQNCTGCCSALNCLCFDDCGECLDSCCYCQECGVNIFLGNICLFFLRILLTILTLSFYGIILIPIISLFVGFWLFAGIITGIISVPCQIISQCEGVGKILAIIFCPFLIFPSIFIGLKQLGDGFSGVFQDYCDVFSGRICDMWISFSPKECCV